MRRILGTSTLSAAFINAVRSISLQNGAKEPTHWQAYGAPARYPNSRTDHPQLKLLRTATEWRFYHGHGSRYGTEGPTRDVPDVEYSDGTPMSLSLRRFARAHHQDYLLVQLIRSAAQVERLAKAQLLPRIPGTPEQRDWDPEIPLFLEDVDEFGKAPPASTTRGEVLQASLQKAFHAPVPQKNLANVHAGETLEPNTMFAAVDPSAFVTTRRTSPRREGKPFWSRRRWNVSNEFLVPKAPKAKNTIKDE
jgi:hypothetical protein